MIVKCPQCSVTYKVPDDKIGAVPRKLRCNHCKHVFAVVRRSAAPPVGYEEFSGHFKSLPPEFAFLREIPSLKPPPPHKEAEAPRSAEEEERITPPIGSAYALESSQATYKGPPPTRPSQPPSAQSPNSPEARNVETGASAKLQPHPEATTATPRGEGDATQPLRRSGQIPIPNTWEDQDPLELNTFAVGLENPRNRLIGMIVSGALAATVLFFVFVAYRNGWTLSSGRLSKSIAYAVSGRPSDQLPAEVSGLEITVESARTIQRIGAPEVLVVEGSVFNNTGVNRSEVVLRLRIFDSSDNIASQVEAPCGSFLKESEIVKLPSGQAPKPSASACTVPADSTAVYQFLLEKFPTGVNLKDDVDVKPIAAAIR
ncbi:MAG: zinc-ribbon domain-containing protein [Myxococcota bacterium]|jgi:predicted Zn finger-like uncharacterized protein|nr:zinc-ribbon domain-containing protein [Myxococcota bacterium]